MPAYASPQLTWEEIIYDFFLREENGVDIVIADVSGHGIGAALIMAETRSVLRTQVRSSGKANDILSSLNDLLHEDLRMWVNFSVWKDSAKQLPQIGKKIPTGLSIR